jgi:hypothetical protein
VQKLKWEIIICKNDYHLQDIQILGEQHRQIWQQQLILLGDLKKRKKLGKKYLRKNTKGYLSEKYIEIRKFKLLK